MSDAAVSAEAGLESLVAGVADEFLDRQRRGERPTAAEYAARHPEAAALLREVLAALEVAGLSGAAGADAGGEPALTGTIGDYRILREVGRGGMGIVYEAEQISLGRRVALKVLPYAATMDGKQLQRFKNEAKAAASLKHEHIVSVYAVGCERGVHFFAMEFIEGQTLAQLIHALDHVSDGPAVGGDATQDYPPSGAATPTAPVAALSTQHSGPRCRAFHRSAAGLIAQAADALEHAHSVGIVHRDMKPGNLLVDEAGKVYVSDFGLARFGPDAGLTLSGDLLGTLRYMAPEQALARHGLVDHRADVYGLGCTLYELLTGRPAVGGVDKADILRHIAFEDPVVPRKLDRAIPAELETIALKCLAKNPNERYATAADLAADLRRWLDDRPITARPPTRRQRLDRWVRRHSAAVAAAAAALLVGTVVSTGLAVIARDARRGAEADRDRARSAERDAVSAAAIANAVNNFLREDLLRLAAGDLQADAGLAAKPDLTVKEAIGRAAAKVGSRFRDQPLVEAAVRRTIGDAYWRLGESEKAIPHLERAVELHAAEFGTDHPDTLDDRNTLASAYLYAGRIDRAIALFGEVLARQQATLGSTHDDTLTTQINLGEAHARAGRPQEAIALLGPAVAAAREHLGADHRTTHGATLNLADCYVRVGRPGEAVALDEPVLAAQTARLGPDHPHTLQTMNNLAVAYGKAGRLPDGLRLLEVAVPKAQARLGPDHPDTILWTHNLARAYVDAARWDRARPLFERVLDHRLAKLRPDDKLTLYALCNAGRARGSTGRHREAVALLEPAAERIERVIGPDDPDTLAALATLAASYWHVGRPADAIPLHERVLHRRRRAPGPDHVDTLRTVVDLSAAYVSVGRPADAIALLEPAVAAVEASYGPGSVVTHAALNNLAEAHRRDRRPDRAVPVHERALELVEGATGSDDPRTIDAIANLVLSYQAVGRKPDADALVDSAVSRAPATVGRTDTRAIDHLWKLVGFCRAVGRPGRAAALLGVLLDHYRTADGRASLPAIKALGELGTIRLQQGQYATAEPLLRECLAGWSEKAPGDWMRFNVQGLLGTALLGRDDYAAAEPLLLQAYDGLKQREPTIPPAGRIRVAETAERLAALYEATGRGDQAKAWRAKLPAPPPGGRTP